MRAIFGLAVCVALAAAAQAASVNNVIMSELGNAGQASILLEDNDASYVIDANQSGTIDNGDILRGMLQVQGVRGPDGTDTFIGAGTIHNELTAVFSIEVVQTNFNGGLWTWNFGVDNTWATQGEVIRAYDDPSQNYNQSGNSIPNALATASDGQLWAMFGLGQTGNWVSRALTNQIAAVSTAPAEGFGFPASVTGEFNVNLIPAGGLGESILTPNIFGFDMTGSFSIFGKTDPFTGQPLNTPFDFTSDADLRIVAVPTPMAVWAAGPLFGLIVVARKRLFA